MLMFIGAAEAKMKIFESVENNRHGARTRRRNDRNNNVSQVNCPADDSADSEGADLGWSV